MFSREGRARLFLAALILVLVLVNSQSLQVSYGSRELLSQLFETSTRELAARIALEIEPDLGAPGQTPDVERLTARLAAMAAENGLRSACVLDWNHRLITGGKCAPPGGGELDRLDRHGRRELMETGWAMTEIAPSYDVDRAQALGYWLLERRGEAGSPGILRIEIPAPRLAEANRQIRTTLIYQVSALSLVLLSVILFLNSLLAPQRRLAAEARSVASELSPEGADDGDEGQFILSTFQDVVSRLKEKEEELQALHQLEKARADEKEALASDIIRSMTSGLVSLDRSSRVVLVNPAAERIFGIESGDVLGRDFAEAFPGSKELGGLARRSLDEGAYHLRGQTMYASGSGGTLHLGVSVIPLLSPDGGTQGAMFLLADLTEVVELRERLFLKENLARLGEMAAGIAHEFRNGLATIMGNAKLLKGHSEVEREEIIDAVLDESQALAHVVTEFMQFARPEPLRVESVKLSDLLRELVDELTPKAEACDVALELKGATVELEGDELLLRKAFQNLILNAIEALRESGTSGTVSIDTTDEDGTVIVRVRDDGPGIPPGEREKIFTPFFTSKGQGTGLGLSVVQKIVVSHNGTIELEDVSPGASFVVRLPPSGEGDVGSATWV